MDIDDCAYVRGTFIFDSHQLHLGSGSLLIPGVFCQMHKEWQAWGAMHERLWAFVSSSMTILWPKLAAWAKALLAFCEMP
jgi:hypothetical protein